MRYFGLVLALVVGLLGTVLVSSAPASANHAWGSYHWARQSNPFTLKLGDNVSSTWDSYLGTTSTDWSVSTVLETTVVAGGSTKRNCSPTYGRVEVCSAGYGYNGWFLGRHPYLGDWSLTVAGVRFISHVQFKRTSVKAPADALVIGDTRPKDDGLWSSSLWWQWACMDPVYGRPYFEGIEQRRHRRTGVVVFADGHSEARKDRNINPARNPADGGPMGLVNSKHWDPLKAAGDR